MICYRDMTFCSVDCVASSCFRNKIYTEKAGALPVDYSDLSKGCPDYETPEQAGKSLPLVKALERAQPQMTGFNSKTKPFYELGIEVASRLHELKGKELTEAEDKAFRKLLQDLGLSESMVNWK